MSDCTCASESPGFMRPSTSKPWPPRLFSLRSSGEKASGPQISASLGISESRGHHAYHRHGHAINVDRASNHAGLAAKDAPP